MPTIRRVEYPSRTQYLSVVELRHSRGHAHIQLVRVCRPQRNSATQAVVLKAAAARISIWHRQTVHTEQSDTVPAKGSLALPTVGIADPSIRCVDCGCRTDIARMQNFSEYPTQQFVLLVSSAAYRIPVLFQSALSVADIIVVQCALGFLYGRAVYRR